MSYKPNEQDWIAFLYGELEGPECEKIEAYLLSNAEARKEFEQFEKLRGALGAVADKEVIAPPIFVGDPKQAPFWTTTYFKTVMSIAASLLVLMLVGKLMGTQMSASDGEFRISFGSSPKTTMPTVAPTPTLSQQDVQQMINASLNQNNIAMQTSWKETQDKLDKSSRQNLAANSGRIDKLVREASAASQDQVRQYVSSLQTENMAMVKNYFQMTSTEQKQYIEGLLVDFAKYLQQQRKDDLQIVQTRLNSLEQNTSVFKEETEQILSIIITTVGTPTNQKETKY